MAEEKGIDLGSLRGSGPNDRILKADIEEAAKAPKKTAAP
jgi:pyruvate dehydrogenase E2 component (dihydrolipoamide acetyltransferase)